MIYKIVITVHYKRSETTYQFKEFHDETYQGNIETVRKALRIAKKRDSRDGNRGFYRVTKVLKEKEPITICIS